MSRHGEMSRDFGVFPSGSSELFRYGRLHEAHTGDESDFGEWIELGRPGGPLEQLSTSSDSKNGWIPAGYIFLGQFIAHDITYDPTSISERISDPTGTWNFRTPHLDLDCVYGAGPLADAHLYDPGQPELFLVRRDGRDDVPRSLRNVAVIADPRNDQTVILSQIHNAFLRFHNTVAESIRQLPEWRNARSKDVFRAARRVVRWHYHWVVLNDYLKRVCLESDYLQTRERLWKTTRRFFSAGGNEPFIPVEFSDAVFRFGHSQVASHYRLRRAEDPRNLMDLSPGVAYAEADWSLYFGDSPDVQPSNRIDRKIESFLFRLPARSVPATLHGTAPFCLPLLTLEKGIARRLPSGQDLARDRVVPERRLKDTEIWAGEGFERFRGAAAPLWYYVLREAEVQPGGRPEDRGRRLGPLGSNIVWTVLVDLISASQPYPDDWTPRIVHTEAPDTFDMRALLSVGRPATPFVVLKDKLLRDIGPPAESR